MSNSIDATDITKVNMVSPEVLECPYPYYERVREEAPVHQTPLGFWAVSRYEDVLSVVRNPEMFSSLAQSNSFVTPPPPEVIEIAKQGYPRVNTLLSNDPPSHTQFRNLVNKAFPSASLNSKIPLAKSLTTSSMPSSSMAKSTW